MSPRRRVTTDRTRVSVSIRTDVLEAAKETSDELIVSLSKIVETALTEWLERLRIPDKPQTEGDTNG